MGTPLLLLPNAPSPCRGSDCLTWGTSSTPLLDSPATDVTLWVNATLYDAKAFFCFVYFFSFFSAESGDFTKEVGDGPCFHSDRWVAYSSILSIYMPDLMDNYRRLESCCSENRGDATLLGQYHNFSLAIVSSFRSGQNGIMVNGSSCQFPGGKRYEILKIYNCSKFNGWTHMSHFYKA